MATAVKKLNIDDVKVGALLLQKKLITEAHLRTAIDYQRSLGGRLLDVLCKLNILRPAQVEQISNLLSKEDGCGEEPPPQVEPAEKSEEPEAEDAVGEETTRVEKDRDDFALAPDSVKPSDLKVHWRLTEKLPKSLIEEHLLLLFFPTGGVPSRKIILGHGRDISPEVRDRVRTIIGVDVVTVPLSPEVAKAFLSGSRQVAGDMANKSVRIVKTPGPPQQGRKEEGGLLLALVNLLSRKGVITLAELEEEFGRSRVPESGEK